MHLKMQLFIQQWFNQESLRQNMLHKNKDIHPKLYQVTRRKESNLNKSDKFASIAKELKKLRLALEEMKR